VEKEIAAFPIVGAGGAVIPTTPAAKDGAIALNAEQRSAARLLGIPEDKYAETLKAERGGNEEVA
jgi:hypothetical protein